MRQATAIRSFKADLWEETGIRPRRAFRLLAAAAAAAILLTACGKELPSRRDLNVLVITLDTTRRDHLACYGYKGIETPHLDALAREGVLFSEATSPVPLTCPAHSSLFTGLFPAHHGVRNNGGFSLGDDRVTLAEILRAKGYATGAFISAYVLNRVFGVDQGFDTYDDDLTHGEESIQEGVFRQRERHAGAVTESAVDWLRAHADEKFFLWAHYYDAHSPYRPPPPYDKLYEQDPYSGEIAYVDSEVGRLLAELEELGLKDRTLIVVVGDHGESLWEHREQAHAFFIYDSTLLVPLIIRCPPTREIRVPEGQTLNGQVRLVDVMPTILSTLEIPAPAGIQGVTLLPFMVEGRNVPDMDLYCETLLPMLDYGWSDLIGIRTGQWKYIDAPTRELYDLEADPWEIDNLADDRPELVEEMRGRLSRLLAGESGQTGEAWATMEISADMQENLRSLGYLGGGGDDRHQRAHLDSLGLREPEGSDPKDMVEVFIPIERASTAMFLGDWDGAIRLLAWALEIEPTNKQANRFMGDCYKQKNLLGKAEEHYQRVLERDPHHPQVLNNLGALYIDLGKYDDAMPLLLRAVAERPSLSDARNNLGVIYLYRDEIDLAMAAFQKAIELDPSMTEARYNLASCFARREMWEKVAEEMKTVVELSPGNREMESMLREAERRARAARKAAG